MVFYCHSSFAQSGFKLSYSDPTRGTYVAPPTQKILAFRRAREKDYYENRDYCNQIDLYLIESFQSLKIDSINTIYREGLKRNMDIINKMKTEGDYAEYSMLIMDVLDDLEKNELYYEDEEEYNNNLLKEKLKKQEEETQKLKLELEYQKSLNTKPQTKKITK
jgi:hypothetical protein